MLHAVRPPCSVNVLHAPCYLILAPCSLKLIVLGSMSGDNDSEGALSTPRPGPGSVLRAHQTMNDQELWASPGVSLHRSIECLSLVAF